MYKYILSVAFVAIGVLVGCNSNTNNKETKGDTTAAVNVVTITKDETNSLSEVITKFVRAYMAKDFQKANSLIHPDLGLYVIYRPGASDTFVKIDSIDVNNPVPAQWSWDMPKFENDYALVYEKLPEYDCGTEKWNKLGFYCDTTANPNQLSNIVAFEEEFESEKFSDEEVDKIEKSEEESFRVILTGKERDMPLVFHVRLYQGKWYVSTIDRAYAGCDA